MDVTSRLELPFERHTLNNGLRVILHVDSSLPLVAANLWYHVGSKNETPGRTGFAHLFEHMLFQGSQHVGNHDHFRYIQQVGGVANGSTWYDRTNYYETVPAHHLDLALWLESDRMGFLLPAITEEKLERQRNVVMNERRQRVDNQPYGLAFEHLSALLYPPDHPYHWPVIGYLEDIAGATLADVEAFFRTYYTPNNAVLTVAGDVSPGRTLRRVEDYFADIPPGPAVPPVTAPLPPLAGERRETLEDQVRLARIYVGYRAPAFGERSWYAADLLSVALTAGKSSLLHHDLVYRRQLAQDVSAYVFPTELVATFLLTATARPGVDPARLEEALFEHLDRAATQGLDETDLERARNRILTAFHSEVQTLEHRADLFSQFTTYFDDPGRLATEPERYLAVEPQEIVDYLRRYCPAEERAVVTVVPEVDAPR